jgi:hypothetical protein
MNYAFTLDDLPLWPMSYPPLNYTAEGIVEKLITVLAKHNIPGVFAFANSWAVVKHPELSRILDQWVSAGHHVGNHTHSHMEFNETSTDEYIADIELAEAHLQPWMSEAPAHCFRHPLCYWGNTQEKADALRSYLRDNGYVTAEVTSWFYEWRWNRAYLNCLDRVDNEGIDYVRESFVNFSLAQLRDDDECAHHWFGHRVKGIIVGHTLPFFADIADDLFCRLTDNGVKFISLDEAAADIAYRDVASVPSSEFLVYQQKLAHAAGAPVPMLDPGGRAAFDRITQMSAGRFERS